MRKINVYSDSLLELFSKDFWQDCQKFIRAMDVKMEHVGVPFMIKTTEYKLQGKVNDKELSCWKSDDHTLWAIEYRTVQDALLSKKRTVYLSERQLNKLDKEKSKEKVEEAEIEIEIDEEMEIPSNDYETPEIEEENDEQSI